MKKFNSTKDFALYHGNVYDLQVKIGLNYDVKHSKFPRPNTEIFVNFMNLFS